MQRWSSGFRICNASSISRAGVFITTLPSSHTPMSVRLIMVMPMIMAMVVVVAMLLMMMIKVMAMK